MARARGFREPIPKVLVICEGSETESPYFKEMQEVATAKGHVFDMKILPGSEDDFSDSDRAAMKKERLLYKANPSAFGKTPRWPYYAKYETDEDTYNKYRTQPTRYVREAQLYLDEGVYTEAWVVYDYDVKSDSRVDKDHFGAYNLKINDDRIHIAFSSYSFEEWLLLHFERNRKAFNNSMCDEYKKSLKLHKKNASIPVACSCCDCLAGYLNERGYIPNYGKNDSGYFKNYTLDKRLELRKKAFVNAAWSRSLDNKPFYERNPYTDVDLFILKMFGREDIIKWVKLDEQFTIYGNGVAVYCEKQNYLLKITDFYANFVLSADSIYWCDEDYRIIESACPNANFVFTEETVVNLSSRPKGKAILCIKESIHETYIDCVLS